MSKLKRHATFSTGTRPKLSSLASAAAAAGSGGGAMRKAASVDFANVPEIMTTPTPSPSVGRRTPGKWNCVQTDHTLKTTVAFDYLLLMSYQTSWQNCKTSCNQQRTLIQFCKDD